MFLDKIAKLMVLWLFVTGKLTKPARAWKRKTGKHPILQFLHWEFWKIGFCIVMTFMALAMTVIPMLLVFVAHHGIMSEFSIENSPSQLERMLAWLLGAWFCIRTFTLTGWAIEYADRKWFPSGKFFEHLMKVVGGVRSMPRYRDIWVLNNPVKFDAGIREQMFKRCELVKMFELEKRGESWLSSLEGEKAYAFSYWNAAVVLDYLDEGRDPLHVFYGEGEKRARAYIAGRKVEKTSLAAHRMKN